MKDENRSRLVLVDAIKGLCIIMIILTHVSTIPQSMKKVILYPFTILPAVPCFLMLSSYIYTYIEGKTDADEWLWKWFDARRFGKRIHRLLVPYVISLLVLFAGLHLFKGVQYISPKTIWLTFLQGGRGPGGYYVVVAFGFLALFPFLRLILDHHPLEGAVCMLLIHIAFEAMCIHVWTISDKLYPRLVFHYLTQFTLGCLLFKYREKLSKSALPAVCMFVGAAYMIGLYYLDYQQILILSSATQSILPSIGVFGTLCYVLSAEKWAKAHERLLLPLCFFGRASWHILLTQEVYYYFARLFKAEARMGNLAVIILTDLLICLSVGALFYVLDERFRRFWRRLQSKGENTSNTSKKMQVMNTEKY